MPTPVVEKGTHVYKATSVVFQCLSKRCQIGVKKIKTVKFKFSLKQNSNSFISI